MNVTGAAIDIISITASAVVLLAMIAGIGIAVWRCRKPKETSKNASLHMVLLDHGGDTDCEDTTVPAEAPAAPNHGRGLGLVMCGRGLGFGLSSRTRSSTPTLLHSLGTYNPYHANHHIIAHANLPTVSNMEYIPKNDDSGDISNSEDVS